MAMDSMLVVEHRHLCNRQTLHYAREQAELMPVPKSDAQDFKAVGLEHHFKALVNFLPNIHKVGGSNGVLGFKAPASFHVTIEALNELKITVFLMLTARLSIGSTPKFKCIYKQTK